MYDAHCVSFIFLIKLVATTIVKISIIQLIQTYKEMKVCVPLGHDQLRQLFRNTGRYNFWVWLSGGQRSYNLCYVVFDHTHQLFLISNIAWRSRARGDQFLESRL